MYFYAMFGCCSMFILLHLDGYLLYIADRCYIWIACHFQTVTPIPAFFISFSSDFISSFQWHTWISKLRPGSFVPWQIMHMHHKPHPAYHTMFMCWLFTMLCASFPVFASSGWFRLGRVCEDPFDYVRLSSSWTRSSSLRDLRQDDHYPWHHFYLCLLVVRSISMLRYLPLVISCLPYCHVQPLTHLPSQPLFG